MKETTSSVLATTRLGVMNVVNRLKGCPSGATRDALRLCGHDDDEISAAVAAGLIRRGVRQYVNPPGQVEWFVVDWAQLAAALKS